MENVLAVKKPSLLYRIVKWFLIVLMALFLLITIPAFIKAISAFIDRGGQPRISQVDTLRGEVASDLTERQIAEVVTPSSQLTSLQRDGALKALKGKVVIWELLVQNVERDGDNYLITSNPGLKFSLFGRSSNNVTSVVLITPASKEERNLIESLKPNQTFTVKARIQGVHSETVRLDPAVLFTPSAIPIQNSPVTKILSNQESIEAKELVRSLAHDKAQEENIKELIKAGALPNIQEAPKTVDASPYVNRFTADCVASKQKDGITLGGLSEKDAVKLAASSCSEARPAFAICIAKPGTTYKSCYSGALPSAE